MQKHFRRKLKGAPGRSSKALVFSKWWKLLCNFVADGSDVGSQMHHSCLLSSFLWLHLVSKRHYHHAALSTVAIAKL